MDSTTATAELGWTINPSQGVSGTNHHTLTLVGIRWEHKRQHPDSDDMNSLKAHLETLNIHFHQVLHPPPLLISLLRSVSSSGKRLAATMKT